MSSPEPPVPPIRQPAVQVVKPFLLCMSCNTELPAGSAVTCPNCEVDLALVRRCPGCQRTLGAQHLRCPYCSMGFVQEVTPVAAGAPLPFPTRRQRAARQIAITVGMAAFMVVMVSLIVYRLVKVAPKSTSVVGQTFALRETSMFRQPSDTSPSIKELQPAEVTEVTGAVFDAVGNRWFEVSAQGVRGYVRAGEVAPPKGTDAESGFVLLRHSLLATDDPEVLDQAVAAVDYYGKAFPQSPHLDEIQWLLADRTYAIAERDGRQKAMLDRAREMYATIAAGKGEYTERARQALDQLTPPAPAGRSFSRPAVSARAARTPAPLGFTVVGGSLTTAHSKPAATAGAPVRSLTVISRTPIPVAIVAATDLSPASTLRGQIDSDITVNGQTAVPKGSACRLTVVKLLPKAGGTAWVTLRLSAVVVDGRTYGVSAVDVRIQSASGAGQSNPRLPASTRIPFRLSAPLIVTRS